MNKKEKRISVDEEIQGISGLKNPFGNKVSSQRLTMFASHMHSAQALTNGEIPDIFSGYELIEGDYLNNEWIIDKDIEVIDIIYKFPRSPLEINPSAVVIFKYIDTGILDYAYINKYVNTTEHFGFETQFDRLKNISKGTLLNKGDEVVVPIQKDIDTGEYKAGVNANVVYMTTLGTYEDAYTISESFAKKLGALTIKKVSIDFDASKCLLNLYGDDIVFKSFPDIGETIRDDGVIASIRHVPKIYTLCDLNKIECSKINPLHDDIVYGMPGATITDINVYTNESHTGQLTKYIDHQVEYYQNIHTTIINNDTNGISDKLNTLMSRAIKYLIKAGKYDNRKKNIVLMEDKEIIKTKVVITYVYTKEIQPGFKLTGRDGSKGIISTIKPDHEMPTDEEGIQADIIADSPSIVKRTVISQLYEQFYSTAMDRIIKRSKQLPPNDRYNKILELVNDINSDYAELIKHHYPNPIEFLNEVDQEGLKLHIPSTANWIDTTHADNISKKYDIKASRVTFSIKDSKGNTRYVKSKFPALIGSKYFLLLYNENKVVGTSLGPTNKLGVPTKMVKNEVIGMLEKTIRFMGEDEKRILINTADPSGVVRLCLLHGFSPKGMEKIVDTIMSSDNTIDIKVPITDDELKMTSPMLRELDNYLKLLGVDISNSKKIRR